MHIRTQLVHTQTRQHRPRHRRLHSHITPTQPQRPPPRIQRNIKRFRIKPDHPSPHRFLRRQPRTRTPLPPRRMRPHQATPNSQLNLATLGTRRQDTPAAPRHPAPRYAMWAHERQPFQNRLRIPAAPIGGAGYQRLPAVRNVDVDAGAKQRVNHHHTRCRETTRLPPA